MRPRAVIRREDAETMLDAEAGVMRRVTGVAVVLMATVGLAACGGGDADPDTDAGEPAVEEDLSLLRGVYDAKASVIDTDIAAEKAGDSAEFEAIFTCVDDGCEEVLQRSTAKPGSRYGSTVHLVKEKRNWVGAVTNEADCPDTDATRSDTISWAWSPNGEGRFAGVITQVFVDCDGAKQRSRTNVDARASEEVEVPYIDGGAADDLKEAISAYDAVLADVYERYEPCAKQLEADDAGPGVQCLLDLLGDWRPGVAGLGEAIAPVAADADGLCGEVLAEVDVDDLLEPMDAAFATLAAAQRTGELTTEPMPPVLEANEPFQTLVVQVARLCIAPDDLDGLGDDGTLVMDVNRTVVPVPAEPDAVTSTTAG